MAAETQTRGPVNALYQRGPRGQCNCNMISTWKNTFLPGKSYCICRTQNAIYIATHTATHTATTATHTATHTAVLLLIPLLILRERGLTLRADHQRIRQPLCWGGIGRIRIRAGRMRSGGGRWPGAASWRCLSVV